MSTICAARLQYISNIWSCTMGVIFWIIEEIRSYLNSDDVRDINYVYIPLVLLRIYLRSSKNLPCISFTYTNSYWNSIYSVSSSSISTTSFFYVVIWHHLYLNQFFYHKFQWLDSSNIISYFQLIFQLKWLKRRIV